MAGSVNNIAATFSSVLSSSSSSSSSLTPSSSVHPSSASFSSSSSISIASSISASWNPHLSLPLSRRFSLLSLYGHPSPIRHCPVSFNRPSLSLRLPSSPLSFLDSAGTLRSLSLHSLTLSAKRAVLLSFPSAFSSSASLSGELVARAPHMKAKGATFLACAAANDPHVMRAWGDAIGAAEAGVAMLSDPHAELAGFMNARCRSCCMVAVDGAVKALFYVDHADDGDALFDDVLRVI